MRKILLFVNFLSIIALNITFAGTTGKLTGKVVDQKSNEPIPFANIVVMGTSLGAATDVNGNYVILNIAPGRYSVKAQSVGYQPVVMENISVSIDLTTKLDFSLGESSVEMKAIVVQGNLDVLKKDVTSSQSSITSEQISTLPVAE